MRRLHAALLPLAFAASLAIGVQHVVAKPGTPTFTPLGDQSDDTPMFLLFTHDDHIKQDTFDVMTAVTDGRQSRKGCPMVATMFTIGSNLTDCGLLRELHSRGYEIADHTVSHKSMHVLDREEIEWELATARSRLAKCGIPKSHICGMRAPFLENTIAMRQVAAGLGFLYDSTLIEQMRGDSYSRHFGQRIWPWDMAHGIPIHCRWYNNITECDPDTEKYPGLWQVPLWDLRDPELGEQTMDYGENCPPDEEDCLYNMLVEHFDMAYAGNRAPMPLFIHTPHLTNGTRLKQYQQFVDYALAKPDVWPATMQQLIAWMKKPIPASELTPEKLGCGTPGGLGPHGAHDGSSSSSVADDSWRSDEEEDGKDGSAEDEGEEEEEGEQSGDKKRGRQWWQQQEWDA